MAIVSLSIVHTFSWRKRSTFALILLSVILSVFVFCEFLIYYIVIIQCQWPQLKSPSSTASKQTSDSILKAMFLSDTHLLGQVNGHWLDKLRRVKYYFMYIKELFEDKKTAEFIVQDVDIGSEMQKHEREWQMERAFQTALWLLQPEIVFILGDAFDEGKWSSSEAWSDDVRRFQKMFRHSADTELIVIVGNHDIGFHYEMTAFKLGRFLKVFNFTSEKLITRKGINFVTVNSIALEGDGCMICKEAEAKLTELSHRLNCSLQDQSQYQKRCSGVDIPPASAPILLQHYPLYRESDSKCTGDDSAPPDKKNDLFREKYDVLSREASQKLLWWFHPRLILSGHTHSACEVLHNRRTPEISIPSFSWRNRNNPSFIMGSITSADFSLYKCFLPFEITVITVYSIAGTVLVVLILARFQPHISPVHFVQRLITKYKAL